MIFEVVVIGDANGAILAYDALCSNHALDDGISLYGEGKFFGQSIFLLSMNLSCEKRIQHRVLQVH